MHGVTPSVIQIKKIYINIIFYFQRCLLHRWVFGTNFLVANEMVSTRNFDCWIFWRSFRWRGVRSDWNKNAQITRFLFLIFCFKTDFSVIHYAYGGPICTVCFAYVEATPPPPTGGKKWFFSHDQAEGSPPEVDSRPASQHHIIKRPVASAGGKRRKNSAHQSWLRSLIHVST